MSRCGVFSAKRANDVRTRAPRVLSDVALLELYGPVKYWAHKYGEVGVQINPARSRRLSTGQALSS